MQNGFKHQLILVYNDHFETINSIRFQEYWHTFSQEQSLFIFNFNISLSLNPIGAISILFFNGTRSVGHSYTYKTRMVIEFLSLIKSIIFLYLIITDDLYLFSIYIYGCVYYTFTTWLPTYET